MAVVKNLMVRAGADFSAITKQANNAKSSMSGMQTTVSKACEKMSSAVQSVGKVFSALGAAVSVAAITSFAKDAKEAYDTQAEGEAKLAQVMRNTIGASEEEIQSLKDLMSAQQSLGVIGDEVQLAGAQELATYVTMTSSLEKLIPVMNDMVAQQYGLSASAESATSIATMLGKVLSGQTSALSRYGYYFTESQEAILKFGTEAQRAATLAEVVEQSVGGMNAALAATPSGRLQQVSNTLGDIKENAGLAVNSILTTFLPALDAVCTVLANLATLANKVAQAISNVFGGGAAQSVSSVVGYTTAATDEMKDLTAATEEAGEAAESLGTFGFDTIQKISGGSSSGGSSSDEESAAAVDLTAGAVTVTAEGADETAETVGWLEDCLSRLKETADGIDFDNLTASLDALKAAAEPLSETLFSGLRWAYNNVLEPLARWTVQTAIPAFLNSLGASAKAVAPALQSLGAALAPLASTAFEGLQWAYENVFIPLSEWVGGEAIPAFLNALGNGSMAVAPALEDLQAAAQPLQTAAFEGLQWAYENVFIPFANWAGADLAPAFLNLLSAGADTLSAAVEALQPMATWLWENLLEPAAEWTGGVIVDVLGSITDALSAMGDWISENQELFQAMALTVGVFFAAWAAGTVISWAATTATTALGVAVSVLTSPITLVIAAIALLVAGIILLVKNWDTVKATAAEVWENIKTEWGKACDWFSETVIEPIANFFTGLWDGITTDASAVWENITTAWNSAGEWFSSHVIEPISSGFKGLVNSIIGFFEGVGNAGVNVVNSIINGINSIQFDVPDWVPSIGGSTFGFNIPKVPSISLPRLAEGAVLPGGHPYAAIVNDQTSGVNVEAPLDTIKQAVSEVMASVQWSLTVTAGAGLPRYLSYELEKEGARRGSRATGG